MNRPPLQVCQRCGEWWRDVVDGVCWECRDYQAQREHAGEAPDSTAGVAMCTCTDCIPPDWRSLDQLDWP